MATFALGDLSGARVLVTGGTGFIGAHLVSSLVGRGIKPVLAQRGKPARDDLRHLPLDLTDPAGIAALVAEVRPDVIFHLAAQTNPARDRSLTETMITCNLQATLTLAQAASENGVGRFVATGTAEEYGHQPAPFVETLPPQPLSPYSASKAACTQWLQMMHATDGVPAVILRPFLIYGPGQMPPKLVPSACLAALRGEDLAMTSGQQMRELTYVGDVVEGLIAAAQVPKAPGEVINLGSGDERSILEIVTMIYALVNQSNKTEQGELAAGQPRPGALPDRPNDMQRYAADTAKAQAYLGWRATTPLEIGLEKTLAWMRQTLL